MPISYVDMRIHSIIEGSFSYEVQQCVSNLSQNHKDVRFEPLVSVYASPHSHQHLCSSMPFNSNIKLFI